MFSPNRRDRRRHTGLAEVFAEKPKTLRKIGERFDGVGFVVEESSPEEDAFWDISPLPAPPGRPGPASYRPPEETW